MSRWRIAEEPEYSNTLYPYRLVFVEEDGKGGKDEYLKFIAHFDSPEYANKVKQALDWMDTLDQGFMRLTPKPQPKAGTARPRPASKKRSTRAKGLK